MRQWASDVLRGGGRLSGEMWAITAHFNPARYANKLRNLLTFARRIRAQGVKLMVVELAVPGMPFVVGDDLADCVVRARSGSVMWQKERLLNIGLRQLPDSCDKVAWLDGDVLFENPEWPRQTAELLERYAVVQPFETACWLRQGVEAIGAGVQAGCTRVLRSTAYDQALSPGNSLFESQMGFAWAARRSVLDSIGFYDRFIAGGGDLIMTGAMYGFTETAMAKKWLMQICSPPQVGDVLSWTKRCHAAVNRSVFYTPGLVFHLWHGSVADRLYDDRFRILQEEAFDPATDLALDSNQCWMWSSGKPNLHRRIADYFRMRKECGQTPSDAGARVVEPVTVQSRAGGALAMDEGELL